MKGKFVTFGEIMLRLSPPNFERLLQSPALVATFGGGEANVAVALAGLGVPTRYVTALPPSHPIADAAMASLHTFGVDTSHCIRSMGRMGTYFLEIGANQRPSKVTYDRAASSISLARPGDFDWPLAFNEAGWFHISGITPALSESAADLSLEAVHKARELGLTISIDLNYRKNLWNYGKTAQEIMPQMVRVADVVLGNEEDFQKSLGMAADVDVHSGELDKDHYRKVAEAVLEEYHNIKIVAVSLRESFSASQNGWSACMHNRERFLTSRRYEINNIVDRVGAGDSFAAGLIYGLRELGTMDDALEFGVAMSCLKHSIPGDFARLHVEDVHAMLRSGGSGRVQR
jgi:2-dehydro-3-deoxygluconokinase